MNSHRPFAATIIALGLMLCVSCRTGPPLPPADFSAPGWVVHQGQAVWKPSRQRPELAGDLLVATNANGNCMIQFSKTPFDLASARVENGRWQIDFGSGKYEFRASGKPPARFAWFQLPSALGGLMPKHPWTFTSRPDGSWHLENSHTGESLEGVLFP